MFQILFHNKKIFSVVAEKKGEVKTMESGKWGGGGAGEEKEEGNEEEEEEEMKKMDEKENDETSLVKTRPTT